MKAVAIMLILVLAFSGTAFAAETVAENNPMTKLGRGVLNIFDAVVEIPGTMIRDTEADGIASGVTKGTVMGVINTVVRALVGVYEVATFPVPIPEGYGPILDDPKFLSK